MNRNDLLQLMQDLQAELEGGHDLPPDVRTSLQRLHDDIAVALEQNVLTEISGARRHAELPASEDSLARRAQELDAAVTAEHPYLTETLRSAADLLGKMGI